MGCHFILSRVRVPHFGSNISKVTFGVCVAFLLHICRYLSATYFYKSSCVCGLCTAILLRICGVFGMSMVEASCIVTCGTDTAYDTLQLCKLAFCSYLQHCCCIHFVFIKFGIKSSSIFRYCCLLHSLMLCLHYDPGVHGSPVCPKRSVLWEFCTLYLCIQVSLDLAKVCYGLLRCP